MTERSAPGSLSARIDRAAAVLYGVYALLAFLVCGSGAVLFAVFVPGLERRRLWVSAAARAWFAVAGIGTRLNGVEKIPSEHCVVVANHASYVDGILLQALLPPRFAFVIKGELQKVPLAHFLLRRIGSRFVDRFVTSTSVRDARRLLKAAVVGESLALFPEGTFHPEPGLQRFRPGAFAAAIKGELPVVPVVIRGSRTILPAHRILPRRGVLQVDVLDPVQPRDTAYGSAGLLAASTRRRILEVLDEPDLADPRPEPPMGKHASFAD